MVSLTMVSVLLVSESPVQGGSPGAGNFFPHCIRFRLSPAQLSTPFTQSTGLSPETAWEDTVAKKWGKQDSNLRRLSHQIYSLAPLAAREFPLQIDLFLVDTPYGPSPPTVTDASPVGAGS